MTTTTATTTTTSATTTLTTTTAQRSHVELRMRRVGVRAADCRVERGGRSQCTASPGTANVDLTRPQCHRRFVRTSRITRSAPSRPEVGAVGWIRSTNSTTSTCRTLLEPRARSFHPEFKVVKRELSGRNATGIDSGPTVLMNNSVVSSSSEQAFSLSTWIRECGTGTAVFSCEHRTDRPIAVPRRSLIGPSS